MIRTLLKWICILLPFLVADASLAQQVLPFPPTPSASTAGRTMEESIYKNRQIPSRLPDSSPNILIILMDDVGPGLPDTYGGEVHTPTLTKLSQEGIAYNRFHSTGMCSPTRASLLTGRNHTRVGNGQITEWSNDWDGFSGLIPKTSATIAEVLKQYGYSTAAFGKWHNTPITDNTQAGPFDYWPTGYGFEYFYGFLAGEASQYEPTLVKNTTYVHPPKTPEQGYHLTDDLADNAIEWLQRHMALQPQKPFLMYWAPGASHGPHHIMKEWADKYKGKFNDGWDNYRRRVFERQKQMGWIPANTQLTERPSSLAAWDDIPDAEKPFQQRLMEVFAGFTEHADHNAGRVVQALEQMGIRENTLVFYIWGDNGSSAEGQSGTISELLAQNQIPTQIAQHIQVANTIGGLGAIGSPKTDNMYHAGWGWAGSTPFKGTKLLGAYFGGTRQTMVVSWPKGIRHDEHPRSQFHHVNDIVPTIYEVLKINPPSVVNGYQQDPIDGTSMAYTFSDPKALGQKHTQFFDIMGSRAIYHDGWLAATFGPRVPWLTVTPGLADWTPDKDKWELYNLEEDFSEANDLAGSQPAKLEAMKELFMIESARNNNLPIGGGLYLLLHPEAMKVNTATKFRYTGNITRTPESTAPRIGTVSNSIIMDVEVPQKAEGVLFAMGGYAGGLTCYVKGGILFYEYNLFEIQRTVISGKTKLPTGKINLNIDFTLSRHEQDKLCSARVNIKVNGKDYASGTVPTTVTQGFSPNECFDIGTDLGSPVSEAYYHKAPFAFNGKVSTMEVVYRK